MPGASIALPGSSACWRKGDLLEVLATADSLQNDFGHGLGAWARSYLLSGSALYRAMYCTLGNDGHCKDKPVQLRAARNRVQHIQSTVGALGSYALGNTPATERGLANPTSSHRHWTIDGVTLVPGRDKRTQTDQG